MTSSENIREQILSAVQRQDANAALAAEYARLCRDLNRRLEQIEEVLDRGDEIQALQMAEIYPPVMEEADALSFFKSREWGRLCEKNQAPVAPEIRVHGINKLNNLYGKGIASTHPLYKELREAILARDDERALKISRTIESLAPGDTAAKAERERLERKVFSNLIVELGKALSKGIEADSIRILEEIEQMSLEEEARDSAEIRAARKIREERDASKALDDVISLLPRLEELRGRDDWRSIAEISARIRDLRTRYSLNLEAAQQSVLENAVAYSDSKRAAAVRESEFREALRSFLICLDDATSRTQARGTLSIPEVSDLLTRLNKEWQLVESFGMPIDPARIEETSRMVESLRNELERLQKSRVTKIAAIAVAVLVLLVASGWFITVQYEAGQMSRELTACRQSRSVASVKKLVSDSDKTYLSKFSPKLASEVEASRKWLEGMEKESGASVEALADLLKRSSDFATEDPVKLDGEYHRLLTRVKELPDEQQKVMQPDLIKLDKAYSDHLAALASSYDKTLEGLLASFDKLSEILAGNGLSLAAIKSNLASQKELETKWESIVRSPIKELPLSASLKAKAEADEEKTKVLASSVEAAEAALAVMGKAAKPEDFRSALERLKGLNLPSCNLISAAKIAWNTECTTDTLLPDLLFPGNAAAYVALKQGNNDENEARRLFPKAILPKEVAPFAAILNDELTPDVKVYSLEGGDPSRTVYSKLEVKTTVDDGDLSVFTGKTYDPKKDSATSPSFSIKTYRANGKGWEKVKKFTAGSDSDASKIYRDLGLQDVITDSMEVRVSAIQLLDRLTQSEAKDPIYQAFVIQQLLEMTSHRPRAWGLQYSPGANNLMKEVDQMIRVTSGNLPQGAWMAPVYQKIVPQLKPLLEKTRRFNGEAQLNKMLAEQVIDDDSFLYAGYVQEDGVPHLVPEIMPAPAELYGISGDPESRKAAIVFNLRKGSEPAAYDETAKPVPLTPLYYLKKGRENMVDAGIRVLRLERFREELTLPPLFAAPSISPVARP